MGECDVVQRHRRITVDEGYAVPQFEHALDEAALRG